jgi:hypothetical protein
MGLVRCQFVALLGVGGLDARFNLPYGFKLRLVLFWRFTWGAEACLLNGLVLHWGLSVHPVSFAESVFLHNL